MNLVEILVALVILVTSSSCSLQLWASSARSAEQAERSQHQLGQLEIALLGSQARLAALAAQPVGSDCADAASWLVGHLQSQPLGAGLSREVSAEPGAALVRVRISAPEVGERQRWLSPAAYGLCGPTEPITEEQTDATL
jgi:type II secretory pathway pseudopilin PulG